MTWSRWPLRRRVLANTKTGHTFRGVLWAKRGPLLVLRDVDMLAGGREPTHVDGEVVVERSNVDFLQVLG